MLQRLIIYLVILALIMKECGAYGKEISWSMMNGNEFQSMSDLAGQKRRSVQSGAYNPNNDDYIRGKSNLDNASTLNFNKNNECALINFDFTHTAPVQQPRSGNYILQPQKHMSRPVWKQIDSHPNPPNYLWYCQPYSCWVLSDNPPSHHDHQCSGGLISSVTQAMTPFEAQLTWMLYNGTHWIKNLPSSLTNPTCQAYKMDSHQPADLDLDTESYHHEDIHDSQAGNLLTTAYGKKTSFLQFLFLGSFLAILIFFNVPSHLYFYFMEKKNYVKKYFMHDMHDNGDKATLALVAASSSKSILSTNDHDQKNLMLVSPSSVDKSVTNLEVADKRVEKKKSRLRLRRPKRFRLSTAVTHHHHHHYAAADQSGALGRNFEFELMEEEDAGDYNTGRFMMMIENSDDFMYDYFDEDACCCTVEDPMHQQEETQLQQLQQQQQPLWIAAAKRMSTIQGRNYSYSYYQNNGGVTTAAPSITSNNYYNNSPRRSFSVYTTDAQNDVASYDEDCLVDQNYDGNNNEDENISSYHIPRVLMNQQQLQPQLSPSLSFFPRDSEQNVATDISNLNCNKNINQNNAHNELHETANPCRVAIQNTSKLNVTNSNNEPELVASCINNVKNIDNNVTNKKLTLTLLHPPTPTPSPASSPMILTPKVGSSCSPPVQCSRSRSCSSSAYFLPPLAPQHKKLACFLNSNSANVSKPTPMIPSATVANVHQLRHTMSPCSPSTYAQANVHPEVDKPSELDTGNFSPSLLTTNNIAKNVQMPTYYVKTPRASNCCTTTCASSAAASPLATSNNNQAIMQRMMMMKKMGNRTSGVVAGVSSSSCSTVTGGSSARMNTNINTNNTTNNQVHPKKAFFLYSPSMSPVHRAAAAVVQPSASSRVPHPLHPALLLPFNTPANSSNSAAAANSFSAANSGSMEEEEDDKDEDEDEKRMMSSMFPSLMYLTQTAENALKRAQRRGAGYEAEEEEEEENSSIMSKINKSLSCPLASSSSSFSLNCSLADAATPPPHYCDSTVTPLMVGKKNEKIMHKNNIMKLEEYNNNSNASQFFAPPPPLLPFSPGTPPPPYYY